VIKADSINAALTKQCDKPRFSDLPGGRRLMLVEKKETCLNEARGELANAQRIKRLVDELPNDDLKNLRMILGPNSTKGSVTRAEMRENMKRGVDKLATEVAKSLPERQAPTTIRARSWIDGLSPSRSEQKKPCKRSWATGIKDRYDAVLANLKEGKSCRVAPNRPVRIFWSEGSYFLPLNEHLTFLKHGHYGHQTPIRELARVALDTQITKRFAARGYTKNHAEADTIAAAQMARHLNYDQASALLDLALEYLYVISDIVLAALVRRVVTLRIRQLKRLITQIKSRLRVTARPPRIRYSGGVFRYRMALLGLTPTGTQTQNSDIVAGTTSPLTQQKMIGTLHVKAHPRTPSDPCAQWRASGREYTRAHARRCGQIAPYGAARACRFDPARHGICRPDQGNHNAQTSLHDQAQVRVRLDAHLVRANRDQHAIVGA
jgi:hypothetical protein